MRAGGKLQFGATKLSLLINRTHINGCPGFSRSLKGSEITRNGTPEDPALYIEQEDGDGVLKLASEVERA